MAKSKSRKGALVLALTLALSLFSRPYWWAVWLIWAGIVVCLVYAFSDWALRRDLALYQKLGRSVVLLVVSCTLSALWSSAFYSQPSPKPAPEPAPPPQPRAYDFTGDREKKFLSLLKPPKKADTLRVGCASWSERACVAAGQFLILLSRAGWNIDGNQVFRLNPQIPRAGVSIVSQPIPGPPLPPHLGRWHRQSLTDMTLHIAFWENGVPNDGESDESLPAGRTGVYFGPEPESLIVCDTRTILYPTWIMKFVYEGKSIRERKAEASEAAEWSKEAEDWLQINIGGTDAKEFRDSVGVQAKMDALMNIAKRIVPPEQQGSGPPPGLPK